MSKSKLQNLRLNPYALGLKFCIIWICKEISSSIKKDLTMRLIYPVVALVGVLLISGCAHHDGAHHGGHDFAAKNYGLTYEQVREAAQDGDADAQYALGYMYYYGQNVTRNGKQARFWIAKAAAQNHQQAIRALKMMGTQAQYASKDNSWNDSARTAPLRNGVQANRWQEVRRPQATTEPEQFRPQVLNNENQATQAQSEPVNANADAKLSQEAKNAPIQLKKGKTGQQSAASDKHQKAHKVAELRKKHTQAALHKKDYNKQLTSKKHAGAKTAARTELESTEATDDLGQADEANGQGQALKGNKATQAGAQSKQASRGQVASASGDADEATVDSDDDAQEAPSLTSSQQKIVHPGQNAALKGNKQAMGQVGFANVKQGIASAKSNASLSSDERSILSAPADHYTVQLMGSGSKAAIQKVVANSQIQQKAKVYHTTLKGKDYFVLIYGSYPSQAAANAAIAHLPAKLQQLKPWVKPYTSVKAGIKTASSGQASERS